MSNNIQLEYIISKNFSLPEDSDEMENSDWFNMWKNKQFPYKEVVEGDILYWYDTRKKRLVWMTTIVQIEKREYSEKSSIYDKYRSPINDKYIAESPDKGYFFLYKIKVLEKINIPKPEYDFSRLGWERVDEENLTRWFNGIPRIDNTILDAIISSKCDSILESLSDLNLKMQFISPEKIEKIISNTIRNDTKFILLFKQAANYTCQYPGCGHRIKKKEGGFYIEIAHIKPAASKGQSIIGNLIALCPNHHKEFDYGNLNIAGQTNSNIWGNLNGHEFSIRLDFGIQ